jgi:hypothetical protein
MLRVDLRMRKKTIKAGPFIGPAFFIESKTVKNKKLISNCSSGEVY